MKPDSQINKDNVASICEEITRRLETIHIGCFQNQTEPLLLISEAYPGVWLEHVYDSVIYAKLDPAKLYLAENTVRLFLSHQTPDGQLPCYIWDGARVHVPPHKLVGYCQIQECVSFGMLCLEVYKLNNDKGFLEECYEGVSKWAKWLHSNRMTTNRGLIEMFCGYDTGHDNSGRLEGLSCKQNYVVNGDEMNAAVLPPNDNAAPVLAVDMNCNFYATNMALSQMAEILGKQTDAKLWQEQANAVKEKLLQLCYCEADSFFYDVDKHGAFRKYLSSTVFHLFSEKVLDRDKDANIIEELYSKHIKNPKEFWTPFPFPSMSVSDPSWKKHEPYNCWGYFSQALIALRCTLWMDEYGFSSDFDVVCQKWLQAVTNAYSQFHMGQELDPITGEPSCSSEWYSSCMLFYLYAARRLGLAK